MKPSTLWAVIGGVVALAVVGYLAWTRASGGMTAAEAKQFATPLNPPTAASAPASPAPTAGGGTPTLPGPGGPALAPGGPALPGPGGALSPGAPR